MSIYESIFNLSIWEIIGLCFIGYLLISFVLFLLDNFFRFCAWGFHVFLARFAAFLASEAEELRKSQSSEVPSDNITR